MKRFNGFYFLLGTMGALTAAPAHAADESNAVVAIVNGYLISDYDLEQRVGLNTILTGMPASAEIRQQVLKSLEDEVIEMQEAARQHKTQVIQADVQKELFALCAANHTTPEQVVGALMQAGIMPQVLGTRLSAQVVWRRLVMERYGNATAMTDEQFSDAMDVYLSDLRRSAIIELK